jgi:hypothetical protein
VFGTAIAEVAPFPLSVASARKRLSAAQFVREILWRMKLIIAVRGFGFLTLLV